ncbi:MAG: hypothetical protein GY793_01430 [Proteobacteria bacterium]|nr:hypothetical protein [Pseudomonadota bacterium]
MPVRVIKVETNDGPKFFSIDNDDFVEQIKDITAGYYTPYKTAEEIINKSLNYLEIILDRYLTSSADITDACKEKFSFFDEITEEERFLSAQFLYNSLACIVEDKYYKLSLLIYTFFVNKSPEEGFLDMARFFVFTHKQEIGWVEKRILMVATEFVNLKESGRLPAIPFKQINKAQ